MASEKVEEVKMRVFPGVERFRFSISFTLITSDTETKV